MKEFTRKRAAGFSLIELLVTMVILLASMAIISSVTFRAFSIRKRESRTTDALTSAQAALSIISREVGNSGFGMYEDATGRIPHNGIVIADSHSHRIRVRANLDNAGGVPGAPGSSTLAINAPGEDVTYFFNLPTSSIVRYDPNGGGTGIPQTSVVVNQISNVTFDYYDYAGLSSQSTGPLLMPTVNTGRVKITVEVELEPVAGQPNNQRITFSSEITLRNNSYMLQQY